jgi:hypothetical protein
MHTGKDSGSTSLFKELHAEASAKKGTKSVSLSADISSALDVGKAHNKKQIKLAHEEALAIAKVIQQSKEDLSIGKIINKHSKSKGGTKDWDNFWNSKHSLVSRLAAEVGKKGAKPAAKGAKGSKGGKKAVVSKAQQVKAAHAALAAKKAHEAKMSKVPSSSFSSTSSPPAPPPSPPIVPQIFQDPPLSVTLVFVFCSRWLLTGILRMAGS